MRRLLIADWSSRNWRRTKYSTGTASMSKFASTICNKSSISFHPPWKPSPKANLKRPFSSCSEFWSTHRSQILEIWRWTMGAFAISPMSSQPMDPKMSKPQLPEEIRHRRGGRQLRPSMERRSRSRRMRSGRMARDWPMSDLRGSMINILY